MPPKRLSIKDVTADECKCLQVSSVRDFFLHRDHSLLSMAAALNNLSANMHAFPFKITWSNAVKCLRDLLPDAIQLVLPLKLAVP